MTPLHDARRHESLTDATWDPDATCAEISRILDDIAASVQADGGWPLHPKDAEAYQKQDTKWCLYGGAAGVVVATEVLRRAGYDSADFRSCLPEIYANYLRDPDLGHVEPGLHLGEIGILTPALLADPDNHEFADHLDDAMTRIVTHEAYEITSGQTGMMYAALALYRATGDCRWKSHFLEGADALWQGWGRTADATAWLWQNRIFGETRSYLGAGHGVAGNFGVFLRGADLLPAQNLQHGLQRTAATLDVLSRTNADMANWYVATPPRQGKLLVQWCHGAAGIVTALGDTPGNEDASSRQIDRLIAQAANLVWHAGPLRKGSGICHGTAGNGYALLAMYRRTSQSVWLERARLFAMHAVLQSRRDRKQYGRGRFSLMTGDAGLAVFLHHCLEPSQSTLPGLDSFA